MFDQVENASLIESGHISDKFPIVNRNISGIDAVVTSYRDFRTYLFSRDEYCSVDEIEGGEGERGKMGDVWRDVPSHVDAAITWKDQKTYFFKGGYNLQTLNYDI